MREMVQCESDGEILARPSHPCRRWTSNGPNVSLPLSRAHGAAGVGRTVRQDFGKLGQPVRTCRLGGRKRFAGSGEDQRAVPRRRNLKDVSGRPDGGSRPGRGAFGIYRNYFCGQELGDGHRKFAWVPRDAGGETQGLGLTVGHGQSRGGPHLGLTPTAVVQCFQQLLIGDLARRRENELIHHPLTEARGSRACSGHRGTWRLRMLASNWARDWVICCNDPDWSSSAVRARRTAGARCNLCR